MEPVDVTGVEQNLYPVMKSITRSALRANITQEQYYDYVKSRGIDKENTKEVEYPLEEGENTVKIIVYCYEKLSDSEDESLDNYAYKTFVGHCTYEAE